MPTNGGRKRDIDALIAAQLAAGKTQKDVAAALSIGETTIVRRMKNPAFRSLIIELRSAMIGRTVGQLADSATAAVSKLRQLLDSQKEGIALSAARAILDALPKLRDSEEIAQRLDELEQRYASVEKPIGERFEAFAPSRNGFH